MRQRDLELLEARLEPHGISIDRLTTDLLAVMRTNDDMRDRVKDLERNEQTHSTEIAQGLASIRSLLQRANRAAREQGIVEDEEPIDEEVPVAHPVLTSDDRIAMARKANPGRTVL